MSVLRSGYALWLSLVLLAACDADTSDGSSDATATSEDETSVAEVTTEVSDDVAPDVSDAVEPDVEDDVADDTSAPVETVDDTSEVVDTVEDVAVEIETSDPCAPNPCERAAQVTCDGNVVVTAPAVGVCSVVDGAARCEYAETRLPCGDDVCNEGVCLPAGDACDYPLPTRASYVTGLRIGNQTRDPEVDQVIDQCCLDFTADGDIDNKLGTLIEQFAVPFEIDVNGELYSQIYWGGRVMLFDLSDLDGAGPFTLYGLDGRDADDDRDNNFGGFGTFHVTRDSFVPGTATPKTRMAATLTDGHLTTDESHFWLEDIPFIAFQVDVLVARASLDALTSLGPDGEGLVFDGTRTLPGQEQTLGAELAGVLPRRQLFEGFNGYVAQECSCLELPPEGLISVDANGFAQCNEPDASACGDDECSQVSGYCSLILGLLSADVDLNGDGDLGGADDGLSVGLFLKATSATVVGIDGCD